MKNIVTKIFLGTLLLSGILNLNAVEANLTDLKAKAAERVGFWQAVIAGLNKTGYKADSDFAKRAESNLARAEKHQQIVKSGKYETFATRARGRKAKATAITKATKKAEPKKEVKKEAKSEKETRAQKRKEARERKEQLAKAKKDASKKVSALKK